MAVWNIDLQACVTAYIVAETAEEAREKLRHHFEGNKSLGLEVQEGVAGDFEISGSGFDDDDLPEVSLSPAMTVNEPDWAELPSYAGGDDEDDDQESVLVQYYRCGTCTWHDINVGEAMDCEGCGTETSPHMSEEA